MNSNAMRGAVLVGIAILLGALILGFGVDDGPRAVATDTNNDAVVVTATATPVFVPPTATPFATQPATVRAPNEVRVQVANAAQIQGLAGEFSTRLNAAGYITAEPTNHEPVTVSTAYFQPGYEADARQILAVFNSPGTAVTPLPNPPPTVSDPDAFGVNVLLIVGSDELARS